jgi:hypothetical protein
MERRSPFARSRRSGAEEEPPESSALTDEAPQESAVETPLEKPAKEGKRGKRSAERDAEIDSAAQTARAPIANLSLVRRERRALLREREQRIRDLGGLMLEMYRRDQFREELVLEHCALAMGIENRIHELDTILSRSRSRRRGAPSPRCDCGAPIFFGARFCANCGRATDLATTGTLCARCSQPLAAGATFCAHCGVVVDSGTGTGSKPRGS